MSIMFSYFPLKVIDKLNLEVFKTLVIYKIGYFGVGLDLAFQILSVRAALKKVAVAKHKCECHRQLCILY